MQFKIQLLSCAVWLLALAATAQGQAKISPNDWAVFSENYKPASMKDTTFLGKESMMLDGKTMAVAFKKGARYKNFRLDCDIAGRVMSGIGFRAKDQQNYHFLYFRPGYGGTKEAIQYVPVYNGSLSWVLYNYPMYEKTADTKSLQWFHATLEVRDQVMKVFVNGSAEPQMEITLIESDFTEGNILLRSMFGESYFANIYIQEVPQLLSDWQISEQFSRKEKLELDPNAKSSTWTKVKPDLGNIINISRYFENPNGVIIAKHTLISETEKDMILSFDFIGKLKIFLNGKEVFYYEKQKLDRIFPGTERIVLHLNKGDNDLKFVSEGDAMIFGEGFNAMGRKQHQNWGFTAELGAKR
jgi:hypothetical protein